MENTIYDRNEKNKTPNKNDAHKSVTDFDYYIKTVVIDGKPFDVVVNVRNKDNGNRFVYEITLKQNKKRTQYGPQLSQTVKNVVDGGVENSNLVSSDETVSQTDPNVNGRFSLKDDMTPEQMERGIREAASMEPVAEVSLDMFQKGAVDLTTQVSDFFDSIGNKVINPQLGEVILNRRGVKDDVSHGIGRKKAASFAAVPEVIEQGKTIDYQRNWKNRGYDTAVVVAPVTMDGNLYYEGVILKRSRGENAFYLHEVLEEKDGAEPFKTGAGISDGLPGGTAPPVISLLQKVAEVNRNMSSEEARFSLKDDGCLEGLVEAEPDRKKQEKASDVQLAGENVRRDGDFIPWEETEKKAREGGTRPAVKPQEQRKIQVCTGFQMELSIKYSKKQKAPGLATGRFLFCLWRKGVYMKNI